MFGSCFRTIAVIPVSDFVFCSVSLKTGLTQTICIHFCIVPLKLAFLFIIILCVFGYYFRTLAVNLVSDFFLIPSAYSLPLIIIVRLVFCFLLSSLVLLFVLSRLDFNNLYVCYSYEFLFFLSRLHYKQSICYSCDIFSLQITLQTILHVYIMHMHASPKLTILAQCGNISLWSSMIISAMCCRLLLWSAGPRSSFTKSRCISGVQPMAWNGNL